MQTNDSFRVLVIDDEPEIIQSFKMAFADHWVVEGITHPDALKADMKSGFKKFQLFDLIFLDLLFDVKVAVKPGNVVERIQGGDLLGIEFLGWLAKNYSCPVVVLSGFLFESVTKALREAYPYVLLKAKPVDLNDAVFRTNMEYYSRTFYRAKWQQFMAEPTDDVVQEVNAILSPDRK